jgi:hypothetical protein
MFKRLLDNVRKIFSQRSEVTGYEQAFRKQLIIEEYKTIHESLRKAKNLGQLLQLRKDIREFQQDVIENYDYSWAKPYLEDLNKLWKHQYRTWKKK